MIRRDFILAGAGFALGGRSRSIEAKPPTLPSINSEKNAIGALIGHNIRGEEVTLDRYRGLPCLISFFTVECIPCTNDLKLMREFFGANRNKGFVNIGVNLDVDFVSLAEYVNLVEKIIPREQQFPIVWRNASGHHDNFGNIVSNPTHFVLDSSHRVRRRRDGVFKAADWDDLWTEISGL